MKTLYSVFATSVFFFLVAVFSLRSPCFIGFFLIICALSLLRKKR